MSPEVLPGDVMRIGTRGMAIFSEDGKRRRWLFRPLSGAAKRVGLIMLNPSDAGADDNDPTVTRCEGFGRREDAGSIEIGNLSDYIETDSKKLATLAAQGVLTDGNSAHYLLHVLGCDLVIAAWGGHPWARGKLARVLPGGAFGAFSLKCLGRTKAGAPNHPLYLPAVKPLEDWP